MRTFRFIAALAFFAAALGCTPINFTPQQPATVGQVDAGIRGRSPQEAYAILAARAQKGECIGDLATPEPVSRYVVMADSIVVGLEGRGTDRYDPKLRPTLVKLLVKNYDSLDIASQIISSKDGAPVRVIAEIAPFQRRDDKIDVIIEPLDPSVNIEGATLVDTPLERYVQMDPTMTHQGFRTRGGYVSQGTEAYARGDVTLNAGYKDGVPLKPQVPTTGYIPGGGKSAKTWGHRLMLKTPDAHTAMLIDAEFRSRFGFAFTDKNIRPTTVTPAFVVITMPNRYQGYWKRYLDVVVRIPVRPPSKEERLRHIDRLAAALNSADPQARYEAECALEAYGRESAPALLESLRGGGGVASRQSALRVLAFVDDARTVDPLIEESRRAQGRFRAESAFLLSILGGDRGGQRLDGIERINARLLEMLDEPEPAARLAALLAIERLGVKTDAVKIAFSEARNFEMYRVETPGETAVVIDSLASVRKIAIFGANVRVKGPFKGGVGPVTVNVTGDGIELQHKRRTGPPLALRTRELTGLVSALDRWYVSVNDIIGLLAQMSERNALGAPLSWAE